MFVNTYICESTFFVPERLRMLIKTALEFVDKKVAKQYETMPFSLQTAARRV